MPHSEKKKGLFGDAYTEHRDDSGQKTGESVEKEGWFGDKYTEHRDATGTKTGESREKTGWFGDDFTEHRDNSGTKTGESRHKTGLFGDEYIEHRDASGNKTGESREKTGLFGNKYLEHRDLRKPPSDDGGSSDIGDALGKIIGFFLIVGIVIWLVMMAVAITVMLSPIWLGGLAVGAITGFVLATRSAAKISDDALARIPVVTEEKRRKSRFRVANEFLNSSIKFNPQILSLIGATVAYGVALTAWPYYTTSDTFTRILLGAGVLAGTILGTLAGRRVFLWEYENRIFERAESEETTRLVAPKLALVFSILGVIALAGFWTASLFQTHGMLNYAKALGFKTELQTAQTTTPPEIAQSPVIANNPPAQPTGNERVNESSAGNQVLLAESPHGLYRCFKVAGDQGNAIFLQKTGRQPLQLLDGMVGGRAAAFSITESELIVDVGTGSLGSVLRSFRNNNGRWQEVPNSIIEAAVAQFRQQVADGEDRGPDHLYINIKSLSPQLLTGSISGNWTASSGRREFSVPFRLSNPLGTSTGKVDGAGEAEESVKQFVISRLNTEASHDLDLILADYAGRVNYWDNGIVDQDFIRKDKTAYFERWPSTREEIEGPISVSKNGDDWVATFKTRFRVENSAKGVAIQGIQQATYTLRTFNNALKIVGENGQVLEKEKIENAPVAASSAPQGEYPGERFPQTRTTSLSPQYLQTLSAEDIRYAINEMFARYGADFPKAEIKQQFSRFSWYRPRPGLDFDDIESQFFSDLERDNLKRLGEARDKVASGRPPSPSSNAGSSLRPSSKSRFVTTRELKKLAGQQVKDTWFYGDFVASRISGNTVIMYPVWSGGFIRGYSTEIRATFRNGIPRFPGRDRLPMDPIDSPAMIRIDQSQPLRITNATRTVKPGTRVEIVVIQAER
jgi:hypothetical protein